MTLGQWASSDLRSDGWLMASFVVAWVAAPGVALLVWPFLFDLVLDAKSGLSVLFGSQNAGA